MTTVFGRRYQLYISQPIKEAEYVANLESQILSSKNYRPLDNTIIFDNMLGLNLTDLSVSSNAPKDAIVLKAARENILNNMDTISANSVLIQNPIQLETTITYSGVSSSGGKDVMELKLMNLSPQTINRINKNCILMLKAGYETDKTLSILYIGTIEKVYTDNDDDGNKITVIICKEGGNAKKSATINQTWERGSSYLDIILTLFTHFAAHGVPKGDFYANIKSMENLDKDLTLNTSLVDAISKVCEMLDLVWFISGGYLYIQDMEVDEARNEDYIKITPDVVIGAINRAEESNSTFNKDDVLDARSNIKLKLFLNPHIRMEQWINVTYGDSKGLFKPLSIKHKLNWNDGDWITELEGKPVNAPSTNKNPNFKG